MKNFLLGILIAVVTALLDQYSKYYIFDLLNSIESRAIVVTPFFNLVMVKNFGVSFGMFNNLAYGYLILSGIALFITIVLLIWMWKERKLYPSIALGLIIGGAIGNIIDRVLFGSVADFLDFHWQGYHWPAFNLADSTVFIGVAMIIMENFVTKNGVGDEEKN